MTRFAYTLMLDFVMKKLTQSDLLVIIRNDVAKSSLNKTAKRIGVSAPYLSDILNSKRAISEKVAALYGFEKNVVTEVSFSKIA